LYYGGGGIFFLMALKGLLLNSSANWYIGFALIVASIAMVGAGYKRLEIAGNLLAY
jgi:hypothetical protein